MCVDCVIKSFFSPKRKCLFAVSQVLIVVCRKDEITAVDETKRKLDNVVSKDEVTKYDFETMSNIRNELLSTSLAVC